MLRPPYSASPAYLMVKETRHLTAPEGGDLSAEPISEAHVVETRYCSGNVLVQLPEYGLARRVESQGGLGREDIVAVVTSRRLLQNNNNNDNNMDVRGRVHSLPHTLHIPALTTAQLPPARRSTVPTATDETNS